MDRLLKVSFRFIQRLLYDNKGEKMHSSDITNKIQYLNEKKNEIHTYFNQMKYQYVFDEELVSDQFNEKNRMMLERHKHELLQRLSVLEEELFRYKQQLKLKEIKQKIALEE